MCSPTPVTLTDSVVELVLNPLTLLLKQWNRESALLSSLFRAAIFFSANLVVGLHVAVAAMLPSLSSAPDVRLLRLDHAIAPRRTAGLAGCAGGDDSADVFHALAPVCRARAPRYAEPVYEHCGFPLLHRNLRAVQLVRDAAWCAYHRRRAIHAGGRHAPDASDRGRPPRCQSAIRDPAGLPIMKHKTLHVTDSWHPMSGGIGTFYKRCSPPPIGANSTSAGRIADARQTAGQYR